MKKVCIVIPIYRSNIGSLEETSLRQAACIFKNRDIIIISPEGLDVSNILDMIPGATVRRFNPDYFKGIPGYNSLMMSAEFYGRFTDYEYMLIYQTDAYVFNDSLDSWCDRGYDYVGAPWLVRPIYNHPLLKLGSAIKHGVRKLAGLPDLKATWWKVGNGGLSLRKIKPHLTAVERLDSIVSEFLSHKGNHIYNEDVFFSTEVNKHGLGFSYPDWREALQFSFDKYPALCYELNGNRLPMGCHSWYKKRMRKFWFPIILGHSDS